MPFGWRERFINRIKNFLFKNYLKIFDKPNKNNFKNIY